MVEFIWVVTNNRHFGLHPSFTKYAVEKETEKTYKVKDGEKVVNGVGREFNRTVIKGYGVFTDLESAINFYVARVQERNQQLKGSLLANDLAIAATLELLK